MDEIGKIFDSNINPNKGHKHMTTETIDRLLSTQEVKVSPSLRQYLLNAKFHVEKIKVIELGTAVMLSTRGEYPSYGGTAKWSQVRVWHKGQFTMKEWQYKYSEGPDHWELLVNGFNKCVLHRNGDDANIEVELEAPERFENRTVWFLFFERFGEPFRPEKIGDIVKERGFENAARMAHEWYEPQRSQALRNLFCFAKQELTFQHEAWIEGILAGRIK